jgi:molybdenum cofactor cytidylyltransferase
MPDTPPPMARIYALIPAAGRSRRMGRPKQLLEIHGQPMLVTVLRAALAADVADITVVTWGDIGRTTAQQLPHDELHRVSLVENADEQSEMIASVRLALRDRLERGNIGARDGFLVCPGDLPGLAASDCDACIAAFRVAPQQIVVATHAGRRGHPLIFPTRMAEFVLSSACDSGLNALPRMHALDVRTVERPTMGVTRDIDTLGDLDALR